MGIVTDLTPLNLKEEKQKFFSDQTQNPQFEYIRDFADKELTQWGAPNENTAEFASKMLYKNGFSAAEKAQEFSESQIVDQCQKLFSELEIQPLKIEFDEEKITRCSLKGERIIFRKPVYFSSINEVNSTLNHEVQTHHLRNLNQKRQGWHLDPAEELYLRNTEEGLATLNSFINQEKTYLRKAFLNYYCVFYASKLSFSTLFKKLLQSGLSENEAWEYSTRTKRGLKDTSHPGGNTKDLVYLSGSIVIWNWFLDSNNDPKDLYLGKISTKEIATKKNISISENELTYPSFMLQPNKYREKIIKIGNDNHFNEMNYDQNTT